MFFPASLRHECCKRNTLQHTATHCNTLQHTATHCNTLQHTATHCASLRHECCKRNTEMRENEFLDVENAKITLLMQSRTRERKGSKGVLLRARMSLQHTTTHCNTLQHTATHCDKDVTQESCSSTLQHTATHCNTLQHTAHLFDTNVASETQRCGKTNSWMWKMEKSPS